MTEYELGTTIDWVGHQWLVVHLTDDRVYLALDHIPFSIPFGRTNRYMDSVLAEYAANFERTIPIGALKQTIITTVENVAGRIFIPTRDMVEREFEWFSEPKHRIAVNQVGDSQFWWLSSPGSTSSVWFVDYNGSIYNDYDPADTFGFRPFVCLKR